MQRSDNSDSNTWFNRNMRSWKLCQNLL